MNPEPKKCILVVDDNIDNLEVVLSALEVDNFQVLTVTSGKSALNCLKSIKPDLILLEAVLEKNERRLFTFSEKSAIVF